MAIFSRACRCPARSDSARFRSVLLRVRLDLPVEPRVGAVFVPETVLEEQDFPAPHHLPVVNTDPVNRVPGDYSSGKKGDVQNIEFPGVACSVNASGMF